MLIDIKCHITSWVHLKYDDCTIGFFVILWVFKMNFKIFFWEEDLKFYQIAKCSISQKW